MKATICISVLINFIVFNKLYITLVVILKG